MKSEENMRLSDAGLASNLDYWKRVADRYRMQRDEALVEVKKLQAILIERTGKAYDGLDYLREIHATRTKARAIVRIKNFFRRFK